MGLGASAVPPLHDRDLRILASYGVETRHLKRLHNKFTEVDSDCNGVWTINEFYDLIEEPRLSMRAPIIDAIFFMSDGAGEGGAGFADWVITFVCFCSLTKEEMLQLFFIILDKDRNGRIEKEELLDFFSYVPAGSGNDRTPIFPVNNKNALDAFRGGNWHSLEFDGLAQLCERFPYIAYPGYHVQETYRSKLLGQSFWNKLDKTRSNVLKTQKVRLTKLPGTDKKVEVRVPGRCTMQDILEYSRRKTQVHAGKRVAADREQEGEKVSSSITKERDEIIARCPLLGMIRNPRCMYYVPYKPQEKIQAQYKSRRPEMEMPEFELDAGPGSTGVAGVRTSAGPATNNMALDWEAGLHDKCQESEDESSEEDDDYETDDEEEMGAIGDGAPPPPTHPPPH